VPAIEARIERVTQRPQGGYDIFIETRQGREMRLQTWRDENANEAGRVRMTGEFWLVDYSESQGKNINPHTNQPYINRFFETASPLAAQAPGNGASGIDPLPQQQQQAHAGIDNLPAPAPRLDPVREWRIALAVGGKLAVATMPLMKEHERTFEIQKQIALAWALWVYETPPPTTSATSSAPPPPSYAQETNAHVAQPGAYNEPGQGYPTPDDIPY
jgi:hypothetical protein